MNFKVKVCHSLYFTYKFKKTYLNPSFCKPSILNKSFLQTCSLNLCLYKLSLWMEVFSNLYLKFFKKFKMEVWKNFHLNHKFLNTSKTSGSFLNFHFFSLGVYNEILFTVIAIFPLVFWNIIRIKYFFKFLWKYLLKWLSILQINYFYTLWKK